MLRRSGKPALDPLARDIRAASEYDDLVPTERVLASDVRPHQPGTEEDDLHLPILPLATDRTERQTAYEMPLHQQRQGEDRQHGDHGERGRLPPIGTLRAGITGDGDRERDRLGAGEDDGEKEFHPTEDEGEGTGGDQPWHRQGQG